jgi:hypothetical protein
MFPPDSQLQPKPDPVQERSQGEDEDGAGGRAEQGVWEVDVG